MTYKRQKLLLVFFMILTYGAFSQSQKMLDDFRYFAREIGNPKPESPVPIQCPSPKEYGWWQAFDRGWLYFTPVKNVPVLVKEPIFSKWAQQGWEQGPIGFPLFNSERFSNAYQETVDKQIFEGGTISFNHVRQQITVEPNPRKIQPGRYRLILLGFTVEKETSDDPFEGDGKGDEVYIRTDSYIVDEYKRATKGEFYQTKVIGDINGQINRINAGSRSDNGGLKTGDSYPFNPWTLRTIPPSTQWHGNRLPLKIWEGEITDNNYLIVVPSIWEWDEHGRNQFEINWSSILDTAVNEMPYMRFRSLGMKHRIPADKIKGNLPLGVYQYTNQLNPEALISTPVFVASKRGVSFEYSYDLREEIAPAHPHAPDIFESIFEGNSGVYRMYLRWERL